MALGIAIAWWLSTDARGLSRWIEELRRTLTLIRQFPESGRPYPMPNIRLARTVTVEPYRIIYVVEDDADEVVIMDLVHLRRGDVVRHLDLMK